MADEESVKTEAVDTTEEVDVDAFEDLESDDTSFDDEPDTEDESSADESEESDESEAEAEETESEESTDEVEEVAEETEEEAAEEDTPSESPEEAQKRYNDEMAKRRIAERKLREEQQAREKERLDAYLKEAEDDDIEYAKRQNEIAQHQINQERTALMQEKLQVGIEKAVASIELFRTGTPEIKEELAKSLDDFERMYIQKDKNGNFVQVDADVYQYLQDKADSIKRLTGIGARQQAKQKTTEKRRTVTRPTRTPKEPVKDQDVDDFEKAFYGE